MKRLGLILLALTMIFSVFTLTACDGADAPTPATETPAAEAPAAEAPASEAPAADPGRPLRIGFAQIGSESDWRVGNTVSIQEAVAAEGWELLFVDANQQQAAQIAALRDFITQGVDYIGFAPVVETGWDQVMQEIKEAGIPVIMLDRNIEMDNRDDYYATWIGANFFNEGERAANWLVSYLEHTGRAGEEINIVELQGTVGSSPMLQRQAGFAEVIAGHPNLNISLSQTGNFETEMGKTVMESFLAQQGADIDVVFAHNDGMAIGAIQAIREFGLNPGEDIIIIGIDAVKLAFEAIIAGDMNATIECSPLLGPQFVEAIKALERGEVLPKITFSNWTDYDDFLYRIYPDRFSSARVHVDERVY